MDQVPAQAETGLSHRAQYFTWGASRWNIARLLEDIAVGILVPKREELSRAFIELYATKALALDKTRGPCDQEVSFVVSVNLKRALALPPEALAKPVVLLRTLSGKGLLRLAGSSDADHVLADGQHRMAKAYFTDVQSLPMYQLTAAQSRKYLYSAPR